MIQKDFLTGGKIFSPGILDHNKQILEKSLLKKKKQWAPWA